MESGERGRFIEFTDLYFQKQSNNVFKKDLIFDFFFLSIGGDKLLVLEGLPANLEYFCLSLSLFTITVGSSPLDTLSLFLRVEADVDWNIWGKSLYRVEVFQFLLRIFNGVFM